MFDSHSKSPTGRPSESTVGVGKASLMKFYHPNSAEYMSNYLVRLIGQKKIKKMVLSEYTHYLILLILLVKIIIPELVLIFQAQTIDLDLHRQYHLILYQKVPV